ncbi:MAG TPA: DUF427 domain-containing protein [bacterium]|nr:DUF427 domain-containing protein [bacterium]
MKAIWNGVQLTEDTDDTIVVEGNHYFPADKVKMEYFKKAEGYHTTCPWKGLCSYYDIEVNGETNQHGAWVYEDPSKAAEEIKEYVAFWNGVEVV